MKKIVCVFLTISIACSCLLFSGCTKGRSLYRGNKSLISSIGISYPYLDGCKTYLTDEDQSIFISYLEKIKLVKVEKTAVFDARPVADDYFAYVRVYGDSNEARSVEFYVFKNGKIQVNGEVVDSWHDGQLNKESMDIILKYQSINFNPAENVRYFNAGIAMKIADNGSQAEIKTYFTSDKIEEDILSKFLESLTGFCSNQMPQQQIVDSVSQILPTSIVDETYAFTFNFKTSATSRPLPKPYYFCGIVASSNMVRIIVEKKVKTSIKYILTDYDMDGSAIKDSIKALAIAK